MTKTLIIFLFLMEMGSGFFVKVLNMSECSDDGCAYFDGSFTEKYPFDQLFTGKLVLDIDLTDDAFLNYEASIWNGINDWDELYLGHRSVCHSLIKSLPYRKMSRTTGFPTKCPIKKGTYQLVNYPFSGQYVVFNTIRGAVSPIVRHTLQLKEGEAVVVCRVIYTVSSDK